MSLSIKDWGEGEYDRVARIQQIKAPGNPAARGAKGVISGAYNPIGLRAGYQALRQGGTAVDAALTAAMAQITVDAGSAISFAGIMTMIHYEAKTGEVTTMNACWNTPKRETDPLSIPGMTDFSAEGMFSGTPSGRTALVPGFLKGVEAAHKRFGRLPFASLFQPSIELARDGFDVYPELERELAKRAGDLQRRPDTKKIVTRPDGGTWRVGDRYVQSELAATLEQVAAEGVDYIYRGAWAERFVAAVQSEGGTIGMDDMAEYDVIWAKPLEGRLGKHRLLTLAGPGLGGMHLVEGLHLAEAADIAGLGHWSKSPESLRRMALLTSFGVAASFTPEPLRAAAFGDLPMDNATRLTREHAARVWPLLDSGQIPPRMPKRGTHSDVVVASDADGNIVAVCHSINSVWWGKTGIFVDGVTIGDPAAHQQYVMAACGAGVRMPDPTCVGMLMDGDKPVLAFSTMGSGLHHKAVQCALNVAQFGMDPKQASDAPALLFPALKGAADMVPRIAAGEFAPSVVDACGLELQQVELEEIRMAEGIWIGLNVDPLRGEMMVSSSQYTNGQAFAV